MTNRDLFNLQDMKVHLLIIGLLIGVIAYYKPVLAFLFGLGFIFLIIRYIKSIEEQEEKWTKYIENLSHEFDSATKHAIFNMPFSLVLLEEDGSVTWYNSKFSEMVDGEADILNNNIEDIFATLDIKNILTKEDKDPVKIQYKDRYYKVHYNIVNDKKSTSKEQKIIMLYWVDDTQYEDINKKYEDGKIVPAVAYIDNFGEVRNSTPEVNRPLIQAEIDRVLNNYTYEHKGFIRKYENDKYTMIFEKKDIDDIVDKKFDVLDKIREIDMGNTIPVTLSMGVGLDADSPHEGYEYAKAAIDIALGRGGDQVVTKKNDFIDFYGGKTKAVEKRNKVKSRVMSHALRQLIDQADRVFVMGHKNADMDSFGASVGIMRACRNRKKKCYFILDDVNPSIQNIYNRMALEEAEYLDAIINPDSAEKMVGRQDLLVVVDNHKPSFTAAPAVLDQTDKVVLIDHHRRGAEFISDPILNYLEPYASSTCELVTEVLSYMDEKVNMSKFDADALLAGITVDTKNFTFQTGVRTFEAASLLKRAGADSTDVSQLFKDDFNTFLSKAEVISTSKIIFKEVAIGRLERDMDDSILIAAQAADDLLKINNIEASFVMTNSKERVHISGRSLGKISAQLILEKLGGGGHLTSAGTQIGNVTIDQAEEMLKKAVEEYLMEGEDE